MRPGFSRSGQLVMVMLMLIASGCCISNKSKAFNVNVSLDEDSWKTFTGGVIPSLEVDIVGINDNEKPKWDAYSPGKYFSPNDPRRRDADRHTVTFTDEDREAKELSRKDPIWKEKWLGKKGKGAKWLFILVNLPGIDQDHPEDSDPRKLVLPLACKEWGWKVKTLDIEIKSSTIVCKTPLKPKKDD